MTKAETSGNGNGNYSTPRAACVIRHGGFLFGGEMYQPIESQIELPILNGETCRYLDTLRESLAYKSVVKVADVLIVYYLGELKTSDFGKLTIQNLGNASTRIEFEAIDPYGDEPGVVGGVLFEGGGDAAPWNDPQEERKRAERREQCTTIADSFFESYREHIQEFAKPTPRAEPSQAAQKNDVSGLFLRHSMFKDHTFPGKNAFQIAQLAQYLIEHPKREYQCQILWLNRLKHTYEGQQTIQLTYQETFTNLGMSGTYARNAYISIYNLLGEAKAELTFPDKFEHGTADYAAIFLPFWEDLVFDASAPRAMPSQGERAANPWEKIGDHGWDRLAVSLLYQGYTDPEISDEINRTSPNKIIAKTVTNRLSFLRGQYPQIVLTRAELKRRANAKSG